MPASSAAPMLPPRPNAAQAGSTSWHLLEKPLAKFKPRLSRGKRDPQQSFAST